MGDPVEDGVRELVATSTNMRPDQVDLDMPIEEVADSLELSGLVVAAEKRFGIRIDDGVIGRLRVPRDLIDVVRERRGSIRS